MLEESAFRPDSLQPSFLPMSFLKDLWLFAMQRKKWWLMPVILVLLILGLVLIFGGGSALAPFIYSLF